jgi:hypothetical protein
MQAVTTIGLDIAKSVFQIHGVDAAGNVIVRRQLKRRYVFAILSEATAVPHRHRSLCFVASLVTRAHSAGAHRTPDAGGLREALC